VNHAGSSERVVRQFWVPASQGRQSTAWNLGPGKNQPQPLLLFVLFLGDPAEPRLVPKTRPCLSAGQAVGAGIVPHAAHRSAQSAATCHRSQRKPTRRDCRWNLEPQALGERDKTVGGRAAGWPPLSVRAAAINGPLQPGWLAIGLARRCIE
jgi:hypothetical protein